MLYSYNKHFSHTDHSCMYSTWRFCMKNTNRDRQGLETDRQTHRHTDTQTKYSNPRCTCAPRVNKQGVFCPPHSRQSVGVKERCVCEEWTVQLHEQSLQRTGVHCRSVTRTGVGEVRVHQQTLSCGSSYNGGKITHCG